MRREPGGVCHRAEGGIAVGVGAVGIPPPVVVGHHGLCVGIVNAVILISEKIILGDGRLGIAGRIDAVKVVLEVVTTDHGPVAGVARDV